MEYNLVTELVTIGDHLDSVINRGYRLRDGRVLLNISAWCSGGASDCDSWRVVNQEDVRGDISSLSEWRQWYELAVDGGRVYTEQCSSSWTDERGHPLRRSLLLDFEVEDMLDTCLGVEFSDGHRELMTKCNALHIEYVELLANRDVRLISISDWIAELESVA